MFLLWRLWNQIITDFFRSYEDQFIELRISEPQTLFYVNKSNIRNLISLKVEIILLEMHKTGAVVLNFKASREVKENRKLISRMNYVLSNLFVSVLISETTSVFFSLLHFTRFSSTMHQQEINFSLPTWLILEQISKQHQYDEGT